jgi:transposase
MGIIVGIDVSKTSIEVYAAGKARSFANTQSGFGQLLRWAKEAKLFVMEATGAYHFALADFLYGEGCRVSVVNPRMASHYAKALGQCHKTDRADARVLAIYAERNEVPAYVPETPAARRLRKLVRHRERIVSGQSVLKRQLAEPGLDPFEERQLKDQGKLLKEHLKLAEQEIHGLIAGDESLACSFALLQSIPGFGPVTAAGLLGEAGDLSRFPSAKHLASYAGVHPRLRESGTSLRARPKMSKSGSAFLRKAMYMNAMAAVRQNGPSRALFLRLLERGHKRMSALGAVMHKQLRIAFGVCSTKRPFSFPTMELTTP